MNEIQAPNQRDLKVLVTPGKEVFRFLKFGSNIADWDITTRTKSSQG